MFPCVELERWFSAVDLEMYSSPFVGQGYQSRLLPISCINRDVPCILVHNEAMVHIWFMGSKNKWLVCNDAGIFLDRAQRDVVAVHGLMIIRPKDDFSAFNCWPSSYVVVAAKQC